MKEKGGFLVKFLPAAFLRILISRNPITRVTVKMVTVMAIAIATMTFLCFLLPPKFTRK